MLSSVYTKMVKKCIKKCLNSPFLNKKIYILFYQCVVEWSYQINGVMQVSDRLDIMTSISGCKITTVEDWEYFRRPEIMMLLDDFVYGARPYEQPDRQEFIIKRCEENWLGTDVIYKEIEIRVNDVAFPVHLYLPKSEKPVPAFVYPLLESQERKFDAQTMVEAEFISVPSIIRRGYAVAIMPVYHVSPDWQHKSQFKQGVFKAMQPNAAHRTHRSWATLSGWSFGFSRILDYMESDPKIDHKNVAAIGHSRGGKVALWAGATDTRFKLVISNSSGTAGAAYTRGKRGEHIKDINVSDWFCDNYHKYDNREEMLPVDQHMLLAAIAPRPLYVKSDGLDIWADPEAELKSARLASAAYELYGLKGIVAGEEIEINKAYHDGMIGYHRSDRDHSLIPEDWEYYMDFADKHLKR